jgi:hypothetical protein
MSTGTWLLTGVDLITRALLTVWRLSLLLLPVAKPIRLPLRPLRLVRIDVVLLRRTEKPTRVTASIRIGITHPAAAVLSPPLAASLRIPHLTALILPVLPAVRLILPTAEITVHQMTDKQRCNHGQWIESLSLIRKTRITVVVRLFRCACEDGDFLSSILLAINKHFAIARVINSTAVVATQHGLDLEIGADAGLVIMRNAIQQI